MGQQFFGLFGLTAAELAVAVVLFMFRQPRRSRFFLRLALTAVVAVFVTILVGWMGSAVTPSLAQSRQFMVQLCTFALMIALMIASILFCWAVSFWSALFVATAAYTMQNLASGCERLLKLVIAETGANMMVEPLSTTIALAVTAAIYLICYRAFIRRIESAGLIVVEDKGMFLVLAVVILIDIVFDLVIRQVDAVGITFFQMCVFRLVHASACACTLVLQYELLFNKRLVADVAALRQLHSDEERQYKLSKETVEAINVKCHDIRHQIRHLDEAGIVAVDKDVLAQVAREVDVYDSMVQTGNAALDVILSEKGLICEREGIRFACMADGSALSFIAATDLYSLFGNALENAIEAVRKVGDPEKRSISLMVKMRMGMADIHVQNYCVGPVRIVDGLPQTSKPDTASHGFGVRSMRQVVERYGGTLAISSGGEVFSLDAVIPLP